MKHVLFIPRWHPARINQLLHGHWSNGHRLKKADREMIHWATREAKIPPAAGKRRVTITIILKPGQRGGDVDAYAKSLLDAAKHAGLIRDDSRQHVEVPPTRYERSTMDGWGTLIELEDL